MSHKKTPTTFDCRFWTIFIPFLLLFILILFLPYQLTKSNWLKLDFTETGQIGDTIGGIMGPFIAIAAAILTFLAFWVQFKANEQQKNDLKIERFENKFYELLNLHKSNVNEMNIADKLYGRKCFIHMFYELRYIYRMVDEKLNDASNDIKQEFKSNEHDKMSLAYRIFFFGIGLHSEKQFVHGFKTHEEELFISIKKQLEQIQNKVLSEFEKNPNKSYVPYGLENNKTENENSIEFYYFPFDGHANRLGHYYRHLYQTLTYITSQDFLDDDEKYSYIKMLRAQMSNFEQLHIYYNAISWFPTEWNVFFTEYRFIKNLPLSLADFYKTPELYFEDDIEKMAKKNIHMFEWLE